VRSGYSSRTVAIERHDKSVRNDDNTDLWLLSRARHAMARDDLRNSTFVIRRSRRGPLDDSSFIYEGFRFPVAHPQGWVHGQNAPDLNGSSGDDLSGVAPGASGGRLLPPAGYRAEM
jgi:hypothetical protein